MISHKQVVSIAHSFNPLETALKTRLFKLFAIVFLFSACVKNTSDLSAAFATASGRAGLLNQRVNEFNKAVYWNDEAKLARLTTLEARPKIAQKLKARRGLENLVETEVEDITFDQDLMQADVVIKTRFYKSAHNIVQEKFEKQTWAFHRFDGGWKLTDILPQEPKGAEI